MKLETVVVASIKVPGFLAKDFGAAVASAKGRDGVQRS